MPISDLLMEGVNLMLLGMGIVFAFLAILVLAMIGMSRLTRALTDTPVHGAPTPPPTTTYPNMEKREELVAAISAAINLYRSGKSR